jgi:hypothetical protein
MGVVRLSAWESAKGGPEGPPFESVPPLRAVRLTVAS